MAEDAGEIAGLCVFYTYSDGHQTFADIRDLYVRPDRRRKGVGTALLEGAKREAVREGCWLLIALPLEEIRDTVRLLKRAGFEMGEHQPYVTVLPTK